MGEKLNLRITNMPTVYTWWIGFLFTFGFVGPDFTGKFLSDLFEIVVMYIVWPYALGVHLGLL